MRYFYTVCVLCVCFTCSFFVHAWFVCHMGGVCIVYALHGMGVLCGVCVVFLRCVHSL